MLEYGRKSTSRLASVTCSAAARTFPAILLGVSVRLSRNRARRLRMQFDRFYGNMAQARGPRQYLQESICPRLNILSRATLSNAGE